MLAKPPARVIAALSSLGGNSEFEEVCKWLEESFAELQTQTAYTKDEVQTRWMQGATQVLDEFLNKKRTARDTLQKMK